MQDYIQSQYLKVLHKYLSFFYDMAREKLKKSYSFLTKLSQINRQAVFFHSMLFGNVGKIKVAHDPDNVFKEMP